MTSYQFNTNLIKSGFHIRWVTVLWSLWITFNMARASPTVEVLWAQSGVNCLNNFPHIWFRCFLFFGSGFRGSIRSIRSKMCFRRGVRVTQGPTTRTNTEGKVNKSLKGLQRSLCHIRCGFMTIFSSKWKRYFEILMKLSIVISVFPLPYVMRRHVSLLQINK